VSTPDDENQADAELFRTGEVASNRIASTFAGVFAALLVATSLIFLVSLILELRTGHPLQLVGQLVGATENPSTPTGEVVIWGAAGTLGAILAIVLPLVVAGGFGLLAAYLVRYRRNSFVMVSAEGIVRQDWRRRQLVLPWSAVKRLIVAHGADARSLVVYYLEPRGRVRRAILGGGSPAYGDSVEPLKQAILRYKSFPRFRRAGWVDQHEVYEE